MDIRVLGKLWVFIIMSVWCCFKMSVTERRNNRMCLYYIKEIDQDNWDNCTLCKGFGLDGYFVGISDEAQNDDHVRESL